MDARAPGEHLSMQTRAPARILVAEDDAPSRAVISRQFADPGLVIVEAVNGSQAVELAQAERFDLIVMDIRMPVLDGLAATRRIRAHERAQGLTPTPVFILTAHESTADRQASEKAGCTGFLCKPVTRAAIDTLWAACPQCRPAPGESTAQGPDISDLIPSFLKISRAEALTMDEALQRGDLETLARLGHSLKGSAANYGFAELSRLGSAIEAGAVAAVAKPELAAHIEELRKNLLAAADFIS